MKTLVLCVDRDDDLGEKANITSPIIGRKDNLRAAIALGITDPEDSDTNSLFAAIQIFDGLVDDNEEAEVATITGHKIVGKRSDTIIMDQLNTLLKVIKPTSIILVTDGREDEFIEPIVSSRVPIRSVHRVIVKQAKDVESFVYMILSAFRNEKVLKRVILPLGLIFVAFGILALMNVSYKVFLGVLALVIGGYLLVRVAHLEDPLGKVWTEMMASMENRRYLAILTWIISIGIFGLGIVLGATHAYAKYGGDNTRFIYLFAWQGAGFLIGAGILYVLGNSLDLYVRKRRAPRFTGIFVSVLLCALFLIYGFLEIFAYFMDYIDKMDFQFLLIMGILFLVSAFAAVVFQTYTRLIVTKSKEPWRR